VGGWNVSPLPGKKKKVSKKVHVHSFQNYQKLEGWEGKEKEEA